MRRLPDEEEAAVIVDPVLEVAMVADDNADSLARVLDDWVQSAD